MTTSAEVSSDVRGAEPSLTSLRLLAQAVAAHPIEIRPQKLSDPRAYMMHNGVIVEASFMAQQPLLLRAQVAVQAAMLTAGSFEPRVLRSLVGRGRATRRYCALEGARAVRTLADSVPAWVVRQVCAINDMPLTTNAEESCELALGKARIPPPPEFFGKIKPMQAIRAWAGGFPATETSQANEQESESDSQDNQESKLLGALSHPLWGKNSLFRDLLGGSSSLTGDPETTDSGAFVSRTASTTSPSRRRGTRAEGRVLSNLASPPYGSVHYPEWDDHAGRYLDDWVTVHELDPWNPDGPREALTLDMVDRPTIKRGLARAVLSPETRGRTAHGEQLHPDGAVDLALWRRAPVGTPPMPFADVRRTRPDVAVLVLLDASDSTQDDVGQGQPVFDQHGALAHRLTTSCYNLGLPVGLYAFQSPGRRVLRMLRIKAFEDKLDMGVRTRLGNVDPTGYTRMGGAIRHATRSLEHAAPGTRRVLVLVSDGFPYDEGYEGSYAAADTRQAIWEARGNGTGCVCVGITAPNPDGLDFRADALAAASALHVGSVEEIEPRIGGLMRQALRDARRRGDHTGIATAGR